MNEKIISRGLTEFSTAGLAIATVLSFQTNHSIAWATLHSFLGWIYVIYRALGFGGGY